MDIDVSAILSTIGVRGLRILVIIVICAVIYRVVAAFLARTLTRVNSADPDAKVEIEKRAITLTRIVKQLLLLALVIIGGMMTLKEVGFAIGPLLTGAGILGLAVGFGAQSLVKDIITGFFLLLENQLRVGDVVEIGGKAGTVEAINLRTTVLRDAEGAVHVVPNGSAGAVTNKTRGWSRMVLDVGVAYRADVDEVIAALKEVGQELWDDPDWRVKLLEPAEVPGVQSLADSSVNVRITIKTRPAMQWTVAREMRRRIKRTFDERGIEIPFPHTTLYIGEGTQGALRYRDDATADVD